MASSSIDGNMGTDGVVGPLSGLFAATMNSQIPNRNHNNNNNDDNDNGQNNMIANYLTNVRASVDIRNSNMVAQSRFSAEVWCPRTD